MLAPNCFSDLYLPTVGSANLSNFAASQSKLKTKCDQAFAVVVTHMKQL